MHFNNFKIAKSLQQIGLDRETLCERLTRLSQMEFPTAIHWNCSFLI